MRSYWSRVWATQMANSDTEKGTSYIVLGL